MYCSKCGHEVKEEDSFCPNCGETMKEAIPPGKKNGQGLSRTHIIIIAAVGFLFIAVVAIFAINFSGLGNNDSATEQNDTEQVIATESEKTEETVNEGFSNEGEVPTESDAADAHLWPTDTYPISYDDLAGYSQEGIAAIRNEIYARHGYIFKSDKWNEYFYQFSWYAPNDNYSDSLLNFMEKSNLEVIINYEKDMGWRDSGTPAGNTGYSLGGYLWPTDQYSITEADLSGYSKSQVAAIRNEIYARHGYIFVSEEWNDYFYQFSWYVPNANYSNALLSNIEQANINTIVNYEKSKGWY